MAVVCQKCFVCVETKLRSRAIATCTFFSECLTSLECHAGVTATVTCFPLDVMRTRVMGPGGHQYGGVVSTFRELLQKEGISSLYVGLLPAMISMAPAGAVFYGVYDLLKV